MKNDIQKKKGKKSYKFYLKYGKLEYFAKCSFQIQHLHIQELIQNQGKKFFKLSDELYDALKEGAKLLFLKLIEEPILNPIEIYKVYYFFKEVKWNILFSFGQQFNSIQIIDLLEQNYAQKVNHQKNSIIHYCWIEFISDLLTFKPIIQQQSLSVEQWNQLLLQKQIIVVPYNQKEASINLAIGKQISSTHQIVIDKVNYDEFSNLKTNLIQMSLRQDQNLKLWNQYFNFDFNNQQKHKKSRKIEQLTCLTQLDQKFIESLIKISKQIQENFIKTCEQKQRLSRFLEQNENKEQQKQHKIKDINFCLQQLEQYLQKYMFCVNELIHYFTFYVEKIQIFKKILRENQSSDINQSGIIQTIEDFQIEFKNFQSKHIIYQIKAWQEILLRISNEEASLSLHLARMKSQNENFINIVQFEEQVTVKCSEVFCFFDESQRILDLINKKNHHIVMMAKSIITNINQQQLQMIELDDMIKFLLDVQQVTLILNIENLQDDNSVPQQVKKDLPSDSELSALQELNNCTIKCLKIQKQIKVISSFQNIQNFKIQQLKQYLENFQEALINDNQCSIQQQEFADITTLIKRHIAFFSSIPEQPNPDDKKQIIVKVEQIEKELVQIKSQCYLLKFSLQDQNIIVYHNIIISYQLNQFFLFNEKWQIIKNTQLNNMNYFQVRFLLSKIINKLMNRANCYKIKQMLFCSPLVEM